MKKMTALILALLMLLSLAACGGGEKEIMPKHHFSVDGGMTICYNVFSNAKYLRNAR